MTWFIGCHLDNSLTRKKIFILFFYFFLYYIATTRYPPIQRLPLIALAVSDVIKNPLGSKTYLLAYLFLFSFILLYYIILFFILLLMSLNFSW